jgi:phosphotransferase system, enzyme I, PtsP
LLDRPRRVAATRSGEASGYPRGGGEQKQRTGDDTCDSLHPAILDAIGHVIEVAHLKGKPVSVRGEMAGDPGDPAGALLLLGMGVDALSMSPMSVPRVKLTLRSLTLRRARALTDVERSKEDGFAIHRLLNGALEEAGV